MIIFIRLTLTQHLISMESAANEVRTSIKPGASESEMVDCDVSVDGSWHKRGHSSMNGFVSAICPENKKVNDYQVFSKFCKGCLYGNRKKEQMNTIVGKRHIFVK